MGKKSDSSLTVGEQRKLAELEAVIEHGARWFVDVGKALMEIQRQRLYTDVGDSFDVYCRKRWGFAKSHSYRLIESAKVVTMLEKSPIGDSAPLPQNEAQARVLADLPDDQTKATVWSKAVETAPKNSEGEPKITAKHLSSVAAEITGKPPKKAEPAPPELKVTADKLGSEVPKYLETAASDPFFDESIKLLNDLVGTVKSKANGPLGTYLLTAKVVEGLQQARNMMVNAKFHALCPVCHGKKGGCKECRKSGFVTLWRLEEIQRY